MRNAHVIFLLLLQFASCDKLSKAENEHRLDNCGKTITNKIYNANYDSDNGRKSPWTVAFSRLTPLGNTVLCTATIISPRHVLIATHCVTKLNNVTNRFNLISGKSSQGDCALKTSDLITEGEKDMESMGIRSGFQLNRTGPAMAKVKKLWMMDFCGAPQSFRTPLVDLTIMELDRELTFGEELNMACVSTSIEDIKPGTLLDFYGYGFNDAMNDTMRMLQGKGLLFMGFEKIYIMNTSPTSNIIFQATSVTQKTIACPGDSGGGPTRVVDGRTTVVGVASKSTCILRGGAQNAREIYMKVATYADKICEYSGICPREEVTTELTTIATTTEPATEPATTPVPSTIAPTQPTTEQTTSVPEPVTLVSTTLAPIEQTEQTERATEKSTTVTEQSKTSTSRPISTTPPEDFETPKDFLIQISGSRGNPNFYPAIFVLFSASISFF